VYRPSKGVEVSSTHSPSHEVEVMIRFRFQNFAPVQKPPVPTDQKGKWTQGLYMVAVKRNISDLAGIKPRATSLQTRSNE